MKYVDTLYFELLVLCSLSAQTTSPLNYTLRFWIWQRYSRVSDLSHLKRRIQIFLKGIRLKYIEIQLSNQELYPQRFQ